MAKAPSCGGKCGPPNIGFCSRCLPSRRFLRPNSRGITRQRPTADHIQIFFVVNEESSMGSLLDQLVHAPPGLLQLALADQLVPDGLWPAIRRGDGHHLHAAATAERTASQA